MNQVPTTRLLVRKPTSRSYATPAPRIVQGAPASAVLLGVVLTFAGPEPAFARATVPAPIPAAATNPTEHPTSPIAGARFYIDPHSSAQIQADRWRNSRPREAEIFARIAAQPSAVWLGEWSGDVRRTVDQVVSTAARDGSTAVLVAYNIPQRDCGQYSSGGARNADRYRSWIREVGRGLRGRRAVVIVEPDGIASMTCLPPKAQAERVALIRDAVHVLKQNGAVVYIDAGNSGWVELSQIAGRLRQSGIDRADGFALNVSNFHTTSANVRYGEKLSKLVGGKHFVIDTSRNGKGANGEWCNPRGRALGALPTARTGHALVDAFLWIKRPGESDGTCQGGPRAGVFWSDYALELASNSNTLAAR